MDAAISAAAGEVGPCVKGAEVMLLAKKYDETEEEAAVVLDPKEEDELALVDPKKEDEAAVVLDPKNVELAVVDPKKEDAVNNKEAKPAIVYKEMPTVVYPEKPSSINLALGLGLGETQVTGWNAETGDTIRRDQMLSQDAKSEKAAGKKGLGYLCYGSHGAMKPKYQ